MTLGKIRVLVMASSSGFAASFARDLLQDRMLEIAASVFTERDALRLLGENGADVLLCDTRITGLNTHAFLQRLKVTRALPVVLLALHSDSASLQMRPMVADLAIFPVLPGPAFAGEVAQKIKKAISPSELSIHKLGYRWRPGMPFSTHFSGIVAIGASAGGTEATEAVLRRMPANMPGIVITQHMPQVFTRVYAERLDKISSLKISEAADGDEIRPGCAMVAPGGMQMRVVRAAGRPYPLVRCGGVEKISGHCPSVDVLFDSVATAMGNNAVGVILTGMGSDGANGLLAMRRKGCQTYGQDEATSMVYGMPRVAFQKGAVKEQLALEDIPLALCSHLMSL